MIGWSWIGKGRNAVLGASVLLLLASSPCVADNSFAVVVNKDNPLSGNSDELARIVARIFLKKQRDWPHDIPSRVYDREPDSPEHQQFVGQVLKMSEGRLAVHWVKMKQVSGETPPRVIRSPGILLRFIEKHKGGVGIIKQDEVASLPSSVKVLFSF